MLEATKRASGVTLVASAPTPEGDRTIADLIEEGAAEPPLRLPAALEDLFYFYTSGTTGTPKGVIRTHGSFHIQHGYLNAMQWGIRREHIIACRDSRHGSGAARRRAQIGGTLIRCTSADAAEGAATSSAKDHRRRHVPTSSA